VNAEIHERARKLIALSGSEQVSNADQAWLNAHLNSCESCREFAENSREAIRSLRAFPIVAGGVLVSTTRIRVRERAQELQRRQEWLWVIWVCCSAVTLCTALTTAILWRGFAWIGQQARLFPPVWQVGFVALYLMPSILAGIILLARGTHLVIHESKSSR
jgi:predicted anti-sigma-YlaC factor YlaD